MLRMQRCHSGWDVGSIRATDASDANASDAGTAGSGEADSPAADTG